MKTLKKKMERNTYKKKTKKNNLKKKKKSTRKKKNIKRNKKTEKKTGGYPTGPINNPGPISNLGNINPVHQKINTRGITAPVLPEVSLNELAFPQAEFWSKSTFSKTAGTFAAMAAGGVALGFSPVVVLASALPGAMANRAFQENPSGFIATAITPMAEVLSYSGVYSSEQINEAANYLLNQADPTFSANRYFDINEQNGNIRVGTLDRINEGEVVRDFGFFEAMNGIVNNVFGHDEAIVGVHNFIHEREQNNNAQQNNFENINLNGANSNVRINENIVLPSMFSATIGLPEIIAMNIGETNALLNDVLQNMSEPETFRAQLSAANAAASASAIQAAIQAAMERQPQRAEKNEIKLKQFNENGQLIIEKLQRAEAIRARRVQQSEAEVNKYNQEVAGPRVRAAQHKQEREIEAENQSIAAQVIIDQQYADSMPEFNNPETPLEQQYDPRFGQQYAENLERFVTNVLNVRQQPNFNANNIGDTSAIFATSAYILRGIIGKLFRKSKAKLDKTKDISKKNKITKLNRIIKSPIEVENEMITNDGINLIRLDTLQLPEITNVSTQDIFQTIPIPIQTQVNTYYATPTYGVYFERSDLSEWSVSPVLEIIMDDEQDNDVDDEPPPLEEQQDVDESVPMDVNDSELMDVNDSEPMNEEESLQMDANEYPTINKFIYIVKFALDDYPDVVEKIIDGISKNVNFVEKMFQENGYNNRFDQIIERVVENDNIDEENKKNISQMLINVILDDLKEIINSEEEDYSSIDNRKKSSIQLPTTTHEIHTSLETARELRDTTTPVIHSSLETTK